VFPRGVVENGSRSGLSRKEFHAEARGNTLREWVNSLR
jgi:hypothetical protein